MKKKVISLFIPLYISINSVYTPVLWYSSDELQWANFMAQSKYIIDASSNPEKYRLSDSITRREMMKVIANITGDQTGKICNGTFSDVKTGDWGCKYIELALSKGIIAKNTNFRPDDSISNAEALKMILKVRGIEKTSNTGNWQTDYVKTAFDKKWYETEWTNYETTATRGWIFMSSHRIINNIQVTQIGAVDDTQTVIDELFDLLQ
jgi:S-layer homology domain